MIGIRTSGAERPYPFQVEVTNRERIVCHVGRVYDSLSAGVYGSSTQNSWPANQNKITQRGLQKAQSYNKTELEYYPKAVKTGSANIFYRGSAQLATRGKATEGTATNSVGENGYISWNRTGPEHEYIILHYIRTTDNPDTNKWCVSAVPESAISDEDIVIAYISQGNVVRQVWRSDFCAPDGGGGGGGGGGNDTTQPHPFQIVKNPDTDTFYVREGTVNNSACSYPNTGLNNVTVWLQTYPTPSIYVGNVDQNTTETTGWLRIGRISHIPSGTGYTTEIYQYIRNSLWLERFKCGSEPAQYWYSQI
jgi:hypothetical protein